MRLIPHKLELLSTRYRLGLSFVLVLGFIVGLDLLSQAIACLGIFRSVPPSLEIGFAPEAWLSVVGLTLGTLVIVISIAAQTIPKIADLYRKDWISLCFIWFVMGGSTHAVYLKFLQDSGVVSTSSLALNLFVFLPFAIVLSFPYVFYVLSNIQPETVIGLIVKRHLSLLRCLTDPNTQVNLTIEKNRNVYHRNLLDGLNQLESIFSYVSFKEPKAKIIQAIGDLIQNYVLMKPEMSRDFFAVSPEIQADIAFQTMTDQLDKLGQGRTFYEQKCFRVLGNAYILLLNAQDFDLASLCGAKIEQVALTAMKAKDSRLLAVTIIRMNTFMRFALKHGKAHDEARHLYNLVYHYRQFIEHLIDFDQQDYTQQCVFYLRSYGNEAYQHGRKGSPLLFIVDVIAAEMRTILIKAYQANWPKEIQRSLLSELLQVDNPPELDPISIEPKQPHSGVRTLQISLALFYLEVEQLDFVDLIILDFLDDRHILGPKVFEVNMDRICDRMKTTQPNYWEATDRGTKNLYFTEHAHQLPRFMGLLKDHIQ